MRQNPIIWNDDYKAKSDIFDYMEVLYRSKRKIGSHSLLSPFEYEAGYQERIGIF